MGGGGGKISGKERTVQSFRNSEKEGVGEKCVAKKKEAR